MSSFNSTILVLGASSDMGGEIIKSIDDGDSLIFAHYHRNDEKIKKLQSEVRSQIVPICADLTQDKDIAALVTEIKTYCPHPDKIIHLPAPKLEFNRFKDIAWEHFQSEVDIELRSIFLVLKEFLPLMAKNRYGKIIFMLSSVCCGMPPKALAPYTTSKYALLGLMKSLAVEFADKKITVNAVSPSMAETSFLSGVPDKLVEVAAAAHPLKRNAVPGDIAPMIKFLLSNEADYITGVNIPIAGGSVF
jgi:3-oxoacyl-[acyl-carrier protein] reductase